MHIPDGFLDGVTAASTWGVAATAVAVALRAERREVDELPAGMLGALAALVFAAQMINVPVAPGTSGHLVGATLIAVLVGPWRGLITMAVVLAVQALLFQDGGLTSYGANLLAMGGAGCFVGYAVALGIARRVGGPRGQAAGAIVGAFCATLAGATLIAFLLAASGLYPLAGIFPVLLISHVPIGLLEAGLTGAVIVTILHWRPDLAAGLQPVPAAHAAPRRGALALGAIGVALTIAVFLSPLASALPDGLDHAAETLGFAGRAKPVLASPLADYRLPLAGLGALGPSACGLLGTLAAAALAWGLSRSLRPLDGSSHR